MADPISVGASVLAFIGLVDRIIRLSKYCIDGIQDTPNDLRMIHCEVSSLRAIVDDLTKTGQLSLLSKGSTLEACTRCLSDLEGLLPAQACQSRRRFTLTELAWPLKQSRARKFLAELSQHKATLLLMMSGDILNELREVKTGIQKLQLDVSESERREIHIWLERTNPSRLHNAAISKHEPQTCAWLARSTELKSWMSSASSDRMLWIHGIPGAGKTVLASFAIEQIKLFCEGTANQKYVYYYCHYSHNQDESLPLLSWVVSQVCRQLKWAPSQLKDLYDRGCEPSTSELQHILELALERLGNLFIVVDAIDESSPRDELVRLLATMTLDTRFQKVRILATSRKYWDIERFFSAISTSISMKNRYVDADIQRHIRTRLNSGFRLQRWRDSFQEIEDALVKKANGMFRWVDCQLHSIERLGNKTKLDSVLENLPADLSETYVRIFDAIPEADRQFVSRVLIWIYGDSRAPWSVRRAINAKLLLEAVTFDLYGSVPASENGVFDWDYLQDLCGCLITVRAQGSAADAANCTVTLAHYTVLEFMTSSHILSTSVPEFALSTQAVLRDFATSVLHQALAADPESDGINWRHDRDAYCLVLGCALKSDKYLQGPEDLELYFRFLDPRNPHYARFRAIQERAIRNTSDRGFRFSVLKLPAEYHTPEGAGERNHMAEILLNALLLDDWMDGEQRPYKATLPPVGGLPEHEVEKLMGQKVAGFIWSLEMKPSPQEFRFDEEVQNLKALLKRDVGRMKRGFPDRRSKGLAEVPYLASST